MNHVALLIVALSTFVVACSAQTIPSVFMYGNVVDFCAHQTYVSQFYNKLSANGKAFYDETYNMMVGIVARNSPNMFQNTLNTFPAQVSRVVELENYWVLATIGNMTGYGQSSFTVYPGFNLCSHQNVMVSYASAHIKSQEARDILFQLFNHFFAQVAQTTVVTYRIVRGAIANKYAAMVPASDAPLFSIISVAYGYNE